MTTTVEIIIEVVYILEVGRDKPGHTSGFFRAVSRASPGPKPVRVLKLVEFGRGRRHWVKTEKARDLRC